MIEPPLINSKMFSLKIVAVATLLLACSGDSPSGTTPPSTVPVAAVKLSRDLFTVVADAWQPVTGSILDASGRTCQAPLTRLGSYAIIGDLRVSMVDRRVLIGGRGHG